MPHRRGTFRENWNELLERFARKGTPAALKDQRRESMPKKPHKPPDIHQELFKRSQSKQDRHHNGVDEKAD